MAELDKIELDLSTYKITVRDRISQTPLVLHFDKPSRKFYFSLIALIVHEMKSKNKLSYIHIRKHENILKQLDNLLSGQNASETIEGLWDKIRIAWRHRLPDLESGIHFKILNREYIPPYEKGGKYRYKCTDEEGDIWANLFQYDEKNTWRFKFAIDSALLDLDDIQLTFGKFKDSDAWKAFIDHLRKTQEPSPHKIEHKQKTIPVSLFRPALIFIIIIIVSGLATWHFYNQPTKPSIVILPFVNLSNDPDKEYFCDGITEEIINNLARLKELRVISRTSAFYFKDKNLDIHTIGEKLNVENVLEGSVKVSGNKLRITAQLVKVADDSHLWAESYDREMKNIFDLQDNLAKEIVCNLKTRLGCKDDDYVKNYTENVEAYNLYLKGRYIRTKMKQKDMIEYFNKALELDPDYALAYIGLAEAYSHLGFFYGDSMKSSYIKGKEAILKALTIDENLSDAHAWLGQIRLFFEWDWKGAETALKKAIEMNPDSSMAHLWYSLYLRAIGRTGDAVVESKLALDLDPFSFVHNHSYGNTLLVDGQFESAIKQAEKTLEMWPENPEALTFLGYFHVLNKNYSKGIAILEHALSLMKRKSSFTLGFLGYAYGRSGDKKNANRILNECLERWDKGNFTPSTIATIYSGLNENKVFEWLNTAIKMHDPRLFNLKVIPHYKPLHSDPRWPELMKKMGFGE